MHPNIEFNNVFFHVLLMITWGANSYGQLGIGYKCEQLLIPTPVSLGATENNLSANNIHCISAGAGHTLILTKGGLIYACGWNLKGQLGLSSESLTFTAITTLHNYKITDISCGWDFSAAITENGQLFVWGSNAFGQLGLPKDVKSVSTPTLVQTVKVKYVSCGLRHMSLVTSSGQLMICGNGSKGQLGLMDSTDNQVRETEFKILPNLNNVISVSCGQFHTLCLTSDDNVFVWGDNKHGQLGLDLPRVLTPQKININVVPQQIFAGWTHSAILTKHGDVINFGRNTYGQLGEEKINSGVPSRLLNVKNIIQMSVGSEHNLAITANNKLFCWGWNEHGNCGTGDTENVTVPIKILSEESVLYTATGTGQSFAVIEKEYVNNEMN
ncbi:uncharacterized protein CBL_06407 [Carabus blaptoides fortunei]